MNNLSPLVAIFTLLALYTPFGWNRHFSDSFESWPQTLILAALTLIGFLAPTATFSGPLRFGYVKYSPDIPNFCQTLPDWSPYGILLAFAFLPFSRVILMGVVPVAWHYMLYQYRDAVREITDKVNNASSRATLAATIAHEHTRATIEYEKQALDFVAVARRDGRQLQSLMITDFFDIASESWAALGRITAPAAETSAAARAVMEHARNVMDSDAPDDDDDDGDTQTGFLARMLLDKATAALASAEDAEWKAKYAQASIKDSRDARSQDATGRQKQLDHEKNVVSIARTLIDRVAYASTTLIFAADAAQKVHRLADQATAAAIAGNMEAATTSATEAVKAADEGAKAERQLFSAKEDARKLLVKLQLG